MGDKSIPYILPPNISKGQLLLSTQVYDIVDLISEGPIYGLIDSSGKYVAAGTQAMAKGIYLNDAPLMDSASNQINYQNFDLDFRLGTSVQTPLTFPKNTSKEKLYNIELQGKWDWSDPETLDIRKVNRREISYGKWQKPNNDPNRTTVIDQDIYPASDPTFVFHEIENSWVDKVRVNVYIESLFKTQHQTVDPNGMGRHQAHWVEFNVEYALRSKDGVLGSATTRTTKIQGLVEQSAYGYSLEISLPERNDGENVRLKIYRKTAESASPVMSRKVRLDSVVEIITKLPFTYPQSVIAGWTLDARTFKSPPQRSYHIRGKMVRVPSNYYPLQDAEDADLLATYSGRPFKSKTMDWRRYDGGEIYATHTNGIESPVNSGAYPPAHIYRGNWDGTFKFEWTDNPAWILYDVLINDVYGLGNFIDPKLIDKWTLYQIGRYCDSVDDAGYFVGVKTLDAGREPRYSCNTIVEQEQEAFTLINYIAGIFRGIAYWANGGIYFADDRPKDPVMYFGNADVKEGVFNYQDTIKNGRFTVCEVAYNDRNDNFLPKIEYVEDADGILNLGIIKNSIQGFGTTSRSEARRLGLYQIYSSQQEPEIVNFTAGGKAMFLRPGDVIGISDEVKQLDRYNGIITDKYLSANRLYLNLDAPLPSGVVTGTNIIVTLPWGFSTLEDLNNASGGVPRHAIEGSRSKQYLMLPVEGISVDRQTIDLAATGIDVYNAPEPSAGDYLVNTGIAINRVPLTEAYKYIPPFSLYVAQTTGAQNGFYRVITIAEKNSNEYEIGCVEYDSGKFYRLENEELGYDNSNDEIFGNWGDTLRPPNPVKSLAVTKQNPMGALFDVNVSWAAPTTPPILAAGLGAGERDPYKVQITDPNGAVTSVTTTGLNAVFNNLATAGYYEAKVWAVGAPTNYLASVPASMSKYIQGNSFASSGIDLSAMRINDRYSGTFASGSGTYYSNSANIVANWSLVTPDSVVIQNGQTVTASSFGIRQDVYFLDSTGGIVTGMTRSGYSSTQMTVYAEELISGFGSYPRNFGIRVEVSGALAPDPAAVSTGYIDVLNPSPIINSVLIEGGNGLYEWTPTGSFEYYPDPTTGLIDFTVNFDYSGYGDVSRIHLYTGAYAGFPIDDTSFYNTIEVGSVPVNSQSFVIDQGLDESGTLYADPYFFGIVVEDSIGTGLPFTGSGGMYSNYIIDNSGNYLEEIDNQLDTILNSGQLYYGQKIHRDVLAVLADSVYGTGALGVGLPMEDWTTLSPTLQALYPSGTTYSGSGVFPRELFHMGTGRARFDGPVLLPRYTMNQLTGAGASSAGLAANQNTGAIVYCTNVTAGAQPVYSNGTNWKKVFDGANVV